MTIPLEHTPETGIAITRHQCELCKTCWTIHLNKQTLEYTEGVIKKGQSWKTGSLFNPICQINRMQHGLFCKILNVITFIKYA